MAKLPQNTGRAQRLAPVRPNVGIEASYRAKLDAEIEALHKSLIWFLRAAYRANEPATMAQDRSAADILNGIMQRLARRWMRRFDKLAPEMAKWFATSAAQRSDATLKSALKKGGFTVKFTTTPAQQDAITASIAENVQLIKSIPEQYLTQVQGILMRSVQQGRDLGYMTGELQKQFGVTKRRAAFISRDQNNKVTAAITKTRQQELGITQATWQHSHGGRHPRSEHIAANGKPYDVAKGMFLEGKWVWPGTEPNCRCVSRSIIPALSAD